MYCSKLATTVYKKNPTEAIIKNMQLTIDLASQMLGFICLNAYAKLSNTQTVL